MGSFATNLQSPNHTFFQCHWLDVGLLWQTSNKVERNRLRLIKLETAPEMTWHNVQLMSQKELAMLEGAMHNLNNV